MCVCVYVQDDSLLSDRLETRFLTATTFGLTAKYFSLSTNVSRPINSVSSLGRSVCLEDTYLDLLISLIRQSGFGHLFSIQDSGFFSVPSPRVSSSEQLGQGIFGFSARNYTFDGFRSVQLFQLTISVTDNWFPSVRSYRPEKNAALKHNRPVHVVAVTGTGGNRALAMPRQWLEDLARRLDTIFPFFSIRTGVVFVL